MGLMSSRPAVKEEEVVSEGEANSEEETENNETEQKDDVSEQDKDKQKDKEKDKNKDKEENLTIQYPPQEKKFYEDAQKLGGEPDEAAQQDRKGKKKKEKIKENANNGDKNSQPNQSQGPKLEDIDPSLLTPEQRKKLALKRKRKNAYARKKIKWQAIREAEEKLKRERMVKEMEENLREEMKGKQKLNRVKKQVTLSKSLEGLISSSPLFVKCPSEDCGFVFEKMKNIDEGASGSSSKHKHNHNHHNHNHDHNHKEESEKDGNKENIPNSENVISVKVENKINGVVLDPIYISHYNEHRFRCRQCSTEFCASCLVYPYHLGKTCEEYRLSLTAKRCRYCKSELPKDSVATICNLGTCSAYAGFACLSKAKCGCLCQLTRKSKPCVCLKSECVKAEKKNQEYSGSSSPPPSSSSSSEPPKSQTDVVRSGNHFNQVEEDYCPICWTEDLGSAPCVELECGHILHEHCVRMKLTVKWPGARITFAYSMCPLCNTPIREKYNFSSLLKQVTELEKTIKMHAMHMLKIEKLLNEPAITTPGRRFYNNPEGYAMDLFSYYMCSKCNQPYYGGKRLCEVNANPDVNFVATDLVCGGCSGGGSCKKHGTDFIFYKCRFCCNLANWFCFGLVHYCEKCHSHPYEYWDYNNRLTSLPPQCPGKEKCPLGIEHPSNGFEEFALGCSICKVETEAGVDMEKIPKLNYRDDDDDY